MFVMMFVQQDCRMSLENRRWSIAVSQKLIMVLGARQVLDVVTSGKGT
jgi:hypothetical protein